MQAMEAAARMGQKINAPVDNSAAIAAKGEERSLALDMRISSEFVDNVMASGLGSQNAKPVVTAALLETAQAASLPADYTVDTATMHPANMVGTYHAWKVKSSYPIPGRMMMDDFRRRFLAMYAGQQDKALQPSRRQRELESEVAVTVAGRTDEHRLPNAMEGLLGKIEAVLDAKDRAVVANESRTRVYEGSPEQVEIFSLLRARKVGIIEDLFKRGEVNVAVVEPGSSATGLLRAVSLGLLTVVRLFAKAGSDCDYTTPRGVCALHCAWDAWMKVKVGHPNKRTRFLITRDIINILLEHGAEPNRSTFTGMTPLHIASSFGHDDIVATLLRFGADRTRRDKQGRTPLDIARASGRSGCVGLLANWGAIERAMRFEEFRAEWGASLEVRRAMEGGLLGRDVGKRATVQPSATGSLVDNPGAAATRTLWQARDKSMRAAGPAGAGRAGAQTAEELIAALNLQELLRARRKAAACENNDGNELYDPSALLAVAEYDLQTDALRAIDAVADAEELGDKAEATKLMLRGEGAAPKKKLPWGRNTGPAHEEEGEDENAVDELARAIAHEEEGEKAAEEAANRRADRAAGIAQEKHEDGTGAVAAAEPHGAGKARVKEREKGQDGAGQARIALLAASATSRDMFATVRSLNGIGSGSVKTGAIAAKGAGPGHGKGERKASGPPGDVSTIAAQLEATKRKEMRIKWKNDTARVERMRERAEEAAVRGVDLLDEEHDAISQLQSLSEGGQGEASAAPGEERLLNEWGDDITEQLKDVLGRDKDEDIVGLNNAQLKERRWRFKMLKYYKGIDKVEASDGHEMQRRRAGVAHMVVNDAPEVIGDYTRTYPDGSLVTRKATVGSAILRPSRFRIDTRSTVDAEGVAAKGEAFEVLMTGAVSTEAELKKALGMRPAAGKAELDGPDVYGPARVGGDAMSVSLHGQDSLHSPEELADAAMERQGEAGAARQKFLDDFAPGATRHVTFGNRAVNPAALLPATSTRRPDAEARDAGDRMGARPAGTREGEGTSVLAALHSHEQAGDKEQKVRRTLTEGRAALNYNAAQAALLATVLDEPGIKGAPVAAKSVKEQLKDEHAAKIAAKKKALIKPPPPETYGQGLVSTWPLHSGGPLILSSGQSLMSMSTLHVLTAARAEYDAEVAKTETVYSKYAEIKAAKAAAAAGKVREVGASTVVPKFNPKDFQVVKKRKPLPAPVPKDPVAEAAAAAEKASVPALSASAVEALSFVTRPPPPRPLYDPAQHEEDTRAGRDPHFAVFRGVQDPWRGSKFNALKPNDAVRM